MAITARGMLPESWESAYAVLCDANRLHHACHDKVFKLTAEGQRVATVLTADGYTVENLRHWPPTKVTASPIPVLKSGEDSVKSDKPASL